MKFTTSTIVFLIALHLIMGASIKSETKESLPNLASEELIRKGSTDGAKLVPHQASAITGNQTVPSQATLNLLGKVISNMQNKQLVTKHSTKQFMGGKLPPFFERIVQRIQNYFSVYNPPEYFENSRPPVTSNDGISIICSNSESDESFSCTPAPETEYEENCEQSTAASHIVSLHEAQPPANDDTAYNVVVTHTVVHDNLINVYSPSAPDSTSSQFVSNVVVILDPFASEVETPIESTTAQNKFQVYVGPARTTENEKNFNTKTYAGASDRVESFQPYNSSSYTVFVRGDKLDEYSNNIKNVNNSSLNPDIPVYVQNSTSLKFIKGEGNSNLREDCESKISDMTIAPIPDSVNAILASRSTPEKSAPIDIPNINLVLVPPDAQKNKSDVKNKYDTADTNTNIEYYVLKPDDGSLSKPKKNDSAAMNFYFLSKTKLDNISPTYLPPEDTDDIISSQDDHSGTSSYIMPVHVNYTSTRKPPLLISLFKRRQGEPR